MPVSHQFSTAIVGLGSMGFGMAASLVRAGHETFGFDMMPAQISKFIAQGGLTGPIADVAPAVDALVVVVLNAAQTREVLLGENGWLGQMKPGAVVIACATVPPEFAKEMSDACCTRGVHYVDAPISGGSAKAALGKLSVMASGTAAAFDAAAPIFDATAETVFRLGDHAGPGSAMKAVNQLLAGVHIATMAEAMTFGISQGVEPDQFLEVISKCAGSSWMLENRAPHIVSGDYTPHSSVNIWPKDLGIVLDVAQTAGFDAPIATAALEQFKAAAAQGLGYEDDAAVAKVYARQAGLKLPGDS